MALLLLSSTAISSEIRDLTIINIDNIGPNKILDIKNNKSVDWWIEMGDKMVLAVDPSSINNLSNTLSIVTTLKEIDIENLAFQTLGHCDHSGLDETLHRQLDVVYSNNSSQLIDLKNFENKKQIYGHDSIVPFEKNRVLSYQYNNRYNQSGLLMRTQTQKLIDAVDPDRWFSQVEYLSSLDRMLNTDLLIAGQWLEAKFDELGLVTSRVSLHNKLQRV